MGLTSNACRLFALPCLLTIAGCHPRDGRAPVRERELMHTYFEDLDGWYPEAAGLTTAKAHSGRYSVVVSPQQPYSVTYRAALGSLSPHHRPLRLTLSAWVWVPKAEDDARLVVSIMPAHDPDHPILNSHVFLNDSNVFGNWHPVSRSIDLPEGIHADSQLVIYLWHGAAKSPVYADDLRLTELW
jgi:hypothetical protein